MVSASIFEDEIRQRREFFERVKTPYTDRDLVADVEEMAEREPENMIAFDCGLTHNAREKGLKCDRQIDGESCAECRAHAEGKALDCGIGTAARRDGKTCAWDNRDDCAECRLVTEERKRDCGMAQHLREQDGAECQGGMGEKCSLCDRAALVRYYEQALKDERGKATPDDFAAIRARLSCGLSEGERESESCRLGSLDVCAECAIAAMGRGIDGAKDCERKAIEHRDAWQKAAEEAQRELEFVRAERNRFFLETQRTPSAPKPAERPASPRRGAYTGPSLFGPPPGAPVSSEPVAAPSSDPAKSPRKTRTMRKVTP